jgi:hypothetical protein
MKLDYQVFCNSLKVLTYLCYQRGCVFPITLVPTRPRGNVDSATRARRHGIPTRARGNEINITSSWQKKTPACPDEE